MGLSHVDAENINAVVIDGRFDLVAVVEAMANVAFVPDPDAGEVEQEIP